MAPVSSTLPVRKRIAVVYNIPMACNRATADFLISSNLMKSEYERRL